MRKIVVTGGLGFIGSNFIHYWNKWYPLDEILIIDKGTYASNEKYLIGVAYQLVRSCITSEITEQQILLFDPDIIVHFAAESHVCNSITDPDVFFKSNIEGTYRMLEICRKLKEKNGKSPIFHHVSTDEVYGDFSLHNVKFNEALPLYPCNPYSASKASSDMLCYGHRHTYGLDITISNCSNNFGPNQHEEKLIPKTIWSAIAGDEMEVYGDGSQKRDWIFVNDHSEAIRKIIDYKGRCKLPPTAIRFCLGGDVVLTNLEMINNVHTALKKVEPDLVYGIKFVDKRKTDDKHYAVSNFNSTVLLVWKPDTNLFWANLEKTVAWYVSQWKKNREIGSKMPPPVNEVRA